MKKRQNSLDASVLLTGLSYGEHVMDAEHVVDELRHTLSGCGNSFIVRCQPDRPMSRDMYVAIARYAKENGMPFAFLYAYQHPPKGKRSHLDAELVHDIRAVAGELFLGEMFGETGSEEAAKDVGYFVEGHAPALPRAETMAEARRSFVDFIRAMTDYNAAMGLKESLVVEATALSAYVLEGGIGIPVLEVLPGDPEKLIAFTRGAAIAYKRKMWGGFVAHEWYGGYRHDDALKMKRLDLTYKYLYMRGANLAFLESGNTEIKSFGYEHGYDSELCQNYRRVIEAFHAFAKENPRPACGPYTKLAFVLGEDDGYTDFMGGSVWEQFGREEWGKGAPEHAWRILSEVFRSPDWHDPFAFDGAGLDLGHAPAYGNYDVIPAGAPLDVMEQYSTLIFVGHNTMSDELYEKLCSFVRGGGTLLMSVAHLSLSAKRLAKENYVHGGDFSELFGAKMRGTSRLNHGVKFSATSAVPCLKYPGTLDFGCDPLLTEGFIDYALLDAEPSEVKAELFDGFEATDSVGVPALIEHRLGRGVALLIAHCDYPGAPAAYPLYRLLVKELIAASHAACDLKVAGSDKVRFSLFYDEGGAERLYLLNTAYDCPSSVRVSYRGTVRDVTLAPCELQALDFAPEP